MAPETLALEDSAIFSATPDDLLEAVRLLAAGAEASPDIAHLLRRSGLSTAAGLTDAGVALFKTAWVLRHHDEARRSLGLALRTLLPIQVLEQELLQFGAVPEAGALELLRLHRCLPPEFDVETLRRFFRNYAATGLLVYSSKFKTVRALEPPPDEARAGEERRLAAMVSPKTPFLNVARLRRIIRTLCGMVWWADRHFGARVLEELAEELDADRVTEVRILSGVATNVLTPRSMKDFERFQEEMANKGIRAEWRADHDASDWHDRWLGDDTGAWNMPPVQERLLGDAPNRRQATI